jgi:hypothetical protein
VVENYGPVQQLARVVLNPHDGELHHSSSMCVCMLQMMFTIGRGRVIRQLSIGDVDRARRCIVGIVLKSLMS